MVLTTGSLTAVVACTVESVTRVLDKCPYCGKMTDIRRRTCHACGWILTRRVNK